MFFLALTVTILFSAMAFQPAKIGKRFFVINSIVALAYITAMLLDGWRNIFQFDHIFGLAHTTGLCIFVITAFFRKNPPVYFGLLCVFSVGLFFANMPSSEFLARTFIVFSGVLVAVGYYMLARHQQPTNNAVLASGEQ